MQRSIRSAWARAAISGTTPPNGACSAPCPCTCDDRISPAPPAGARTTAAAVSSQLLSMPRRVSGAVIRRRLSGVMRAANTTVMARQSRQGMPPPFLLTRPEGRADGLADLIRRRFGAQSRILHAPLMAPEFLDADPPEGIAGLIFTSETGVAAFGRLSPGLRLPAWCVGDSTAAAARAAGHDARSAAGDAAALVALLAGLRPSGLLLHARGQDSRGDVAGRLSAAGLSVAEAVVYRQIAVALTDAARALLAGGDAVALPLLSPRTARILAGQLQAAPARAPLWVAALSPAVAAEAQALAPARLQIAARPDLSALVGALAGAIAATTQP
jgi:uroporphyrinogen-III synthase